MKRIAAPLIGGIFTSFILELIVYPVVYAVEVAHGGQKTNRHVMMCVTINATVQLCAENDIAQKYPA